MVQNRPPVPGFSLSCCWGTAPQVLPQLGLGPPNAPTSSHCTPRKKLGTGEDGGEGIKPQVTEWRVKSERRAGTGPGQLRPPDTGALLRCPTLPRWLLGPGRAGPGGFSGELPARAQWVMRLLRQGPFSRPGASGPSMRAPARGAQVPGQRFCAGGGCRAGRAGGLSARASSRELRVGRRIKAS